MTTILATRGDGKVVEVPAALVGAWVSMLLHRIASAHTLPDLGLHPVARHGPIG